MSEQKPHRMDVELSSDWLAVETIVCPYAPTDPERPCKMVEEDGTLIDGCIIVDWFDAAGMEAIAVEGFVFSTEIVYAGFDGDSPKIRSAKAPDPRVVLLPDPKSEEQ